MQSRSCNKTAIIRQLVKCVDDAKVRPRCSLNIAEFVSFWLAFQYSQKVRIFVARVLLECLHDSQDAQLLFCENQDNEGGMNFTPSASSLIVLNVVMQNQHIFKDARSFNSFKKHCSVLKADLESAPRPADNEGSRQRAPTPPPKCWVYSLLKQQNSQQEANVNQNIEQAKLNDLDSQMVDPLDNLIGFYCVVGCKSVVAGERSSSVISQGVAGSTNARAQGVTSALCVRTNELSKNPAISTAASKKNNTVSKKVSNSHQMTSAGSGSESATMIKAFAQKLGPASSLIATSDASASNRHQGQSTNNTAADDMNQFPTPGVARLSFPKGYNQMMQATLKEKHSGRFNTMALSDHTARINSNQLLAGG